MSRMDPTDEFVEQKDTQAGKWVQPLQSSLTKF